MAEIILSIERTGLLTLLQLQDKGIKVGGYLIDPESIIELQESDGSSRRLDFVSQTVMAVKRLEAEVILIDPRLSQDKEEKMIKDVGYFLNRKPKLDRATNYFKPTHLTVDYYANRASMLAFIDTCMEYDVIPVCFTTSSRSTDQDFADRDTTADVFARKSTEVISEIGFKTVMCAAADSPIVQKVNPSLTVFATGGALDLTGVMHPRPVLIEDAAPYVDYFILGNSVYEKPNSIQAYKLRQEAANIPFA